ncbi:UNC-50-like protein, partial [Cynara cardunculus var. scolymus]
MRKGFCNCVFHSSSSSAETKNQWARDDPAFIVVCILLLAVTTLAYCATFLTNTYLLEETPNSHVVEQRVEWQVHELTFPLFFSVNILANWNFENVLPTGCTHSMCTVIPSSLLHFFLSPLLVAHGFIPLLLSNVILMVAVSYYHYLKLFRHIFCAVLPFLEKTTLFLYPIGVYGLNLAVILSGFNPSRYFLNVYFSKR